MTPQHKIVCGRDFCYLYTVLIQWSWIPFFVRCVSHDRCIINVESAHIFASFAKFGMADIIDRRPNVIE